MNYEPKSMWQHATIMLIFIMINGAYFIRQQGIELRHEKEANKACNDCRDDRRQDRYLRKTGQVKILWEAHKAAPREPKIDTMLNDLINDL